MPPSPEPSASESTLAVRHWLERHKSGDASARQQLLDISMRRLRLLARRILTDIPSVRQFEETDDLLQNSVVRLWKYLSEHQPETPIDFFRLAACMIRRELIDLSRHHFGQQSAGSAAGTWSAAEESAIVRPHPVFQNDDTHDPQRLSQWTEFHEYVEKLPDEERSLFDLLWYQGLTMAETSELLSIPLRTLGRRWKLVRVKLYKDLLSEPGSEEVL
jgi:RNA polymerase sigma-70 factor (ECF subfamily)